MRKRILKKLNSLGIGHKLTLFVYCSAFILISLLSFALFSNSRRFALQEFLATSNALCEGGSHLVEKERYYMLGVAEHYSASNEMQSYLERSNAGEAVTLPDSIFDGVTSKRYLSSCTVYDLSGKPIGYTSIDGSMDPVIQSIDSKARLGRLLSVGGHAWEFIDAGAPDYMRMDNSPKLCLWYAVKEAHAPDVLGFMAVTLDSRRLLSTSKLISDLYDRLMIFDMDSERIAVNHTGIELNGSDVGHLLSKAAENQGQFLTEVNGAACYAFYTKVENAPLVIYHIAPDDTYQLVSKELFGNSLFAILCFVLLLLPVLMIISKILIKPLKRLRDTMIAFINGDYHAQIEIGSNDEIGELGRVFNALVNRQNELVNQTIALELKKQEAELSTLQAQINPHFLYNTINAIHWSALRRGEKDIAQMAYSLGQVFRISLNRGNTMTTLGMEYELISYYLSLQKKRYGSRMHFTITDDKPARRVQIPKLIVQPLIENCVVHGLEEVTDPIHIHVHAMIEEGVLIITVTDDGKGIPEGILSKLPDTLHKEQPGTNGSRYALKNISERLRLTYAQNASLEIHSVYGCGTTVVIRLPAQEIQQEVQMEEVEKIC
ncbi:sensor histidine kinase [Christensenellaceae bacterium OttesenSCG-928-M15]|nr:sensor histidine kinase [Christensenellaceae bacterium OttesenSCG-928-M15]